MGQERCVTVDSCETSSPILRGQMFVSLTGVASPNPSEADLPPKSSQFGALRPSFFGQSVL